METTQDPPHPERIGYSQSAQAAIARATDLAEGHGQEAATTAHLLQALLDDPDVADRLNAVSIDQQSLRAQLAPLLDSDKE